MGVMRFLIHPPSVVSDCPEIYRAYISGFDGRVFPTRVEIDGHLMACRRPVAESGKLYVSWPVEGFGAPVLGTSSLSEREEPYILAVELARGKISEVREQVSSWELQGMAVPEEFRRLHREAHRLFAKAAAAQDAPEAASELALQSLQTECRAADLLAEAYARQRLHFLWQRSHQPPALLGCQLDRSIPTQAETGKFTETFSAARVPIEWRFIEPVEGNYNWDLNDTQVRWCEENRLLTYGGPLIDLSPNGLPTWLWQWEQDVVNLQSFVCDFVETALSRYYGRIRTWEVSARANSGGAMTLTEEERLSLVARTLEVARQVDEEIQLIIGVDQPWGDYQARGQHRLSPYQFVDALVRSGVGLTALNLELGIGYQPRGTAARDRLAFSRLIDRWSTLGLPLYLTLAVPSQCTTDSHGESDLEVPAQSSWKIPWNEPAQAEWIEQFLPLLIAKQPVLGIFWAHLTDTAAQRFPYGGLIREDGTPKPALQRLHTTALSGGTE